MLITKTKQFKCRKSLYQRKWLLSCYRFSFLLIQEQMLTIYLWNVNKHHYQVRTIKVLPEQWTRRQRMSQKYYCPVITLCKWFQLEWHFAIVPWGHVSQFFHLDNTCKERCHVAVRSVTLTFSHTQNRISSTVLGKQINTLRPRQNGHHFPDDVFKYIFLNGNELISINISLKFVPSGLINIFPALVQIMAWRRPGDKPFSEPMPVSLLTHICITRPKWVKIV